MAADPPIDFQQIAQGPVGPTNLDYPYAIKATHLMQNFVFATVEIADGVYEDTTGLQGHPKRRLKIPSPPGSGTHVLGTIDGEIQWIATEDCEE